MPKSELQIVTDSREQQALSFDLCDGVGGVVVKALKTGDYSIVGLEDVIAVETKRSANELASNASQARFLACLERMQAMPEAHVVLQFHLQDLLDYPYGSKLPAAVRNKIRITGRFVLAKILQWMHDYDRVKWHFCGPGTAGRDMVLAILRAAHKRHSPKPPAKDPISRV